MNFHEQEWDSKVEKISPPSYLQEMAKQDAEDVKNLNLHNLDEAYYFEFKNTTLFTVFIFFMGCCVYLWYYSYSNSILGRVTNGMDFRGNACNQNQLKGKMFLYYPSVISDPQFAMCVEQCPTSFASNICLYDSNGVYYDYTSQSQLCYQSLQSINQGKYCFPLEPISTATINRNINVPEQQVNRVVSDIVNAFPNIILAVFLGILVAILLNVFFLKYPIINRLFGIICITLNIIFMLLITVLTLVNYLKYVKIYCPRGQNQQCNFGKVFTYKITFYVLLALLVGFVAFSIYSFKAVFRTLKFGDYTNMFNLSANSLYKWGLFFIVHVTTILFFGSAAAMSIANSTLDAQYCESINNNNIEVAVWSSIRYYVFGSVLFCYAVSVKFIEKINYYLISIEQVEMTIADRLKSVFYHSGQLFMLAVLDLVFYPLKLVCQFLFEIFESVKKQDSYNRYFQTFFLVYPLLFVHHYFLRFLSRDAIVLFPYKQTYKHKTEIAYHLKMQIPVNDQPKQDTNFITQHLRLFATLLTTLISLLLLNSASTITGYPVTLIENPLTIILTSSALTFFLCVPYAKQKLIRLQILVAHYRRFKILQNAEAETLKQKYPALLRQAAEISEQNHEITKQVINLEPTKTEEDIMPGITTFKMVQE